jgi:hypothetical protein
VSEFNWRSEIPTRLSRRLSNKGVLDESEVAAVAGLFDLHDDKFDILVSQKQGSRGEGNSEAVVTKEESILVSQKEAFRGEEKSELVVPEGESSVVDTEEQRKMREDVFKFLQQD